jgi:hypothetical protein
MLFVTGITALPHSFVLLFLQTMSISKIWSLLSFVLLNSFALSAQHHIRFKTGNFDARPIDTSARVGTAQYLFFQSDHVLDLDEKAHMRRAGMEVLYALQDHVYWVRVSPEAVKMFSGSLFDVDRNYKKDPELPDRSASHLYRLSVAPGLPIEEVNAWASAHQISLLETRLLTYGSIDVFASSVDVLLQTPWICYIGQIPVNEPINYRAHHGERGWGLTSPLYRGLDGHGVTVGIGDGGRLGLHDDFAAGVTDLSSFAMSNHATQVSGIITGPGLIDPFYGMGYAPKARVLLRNFSDILLDAPQYINDYGMRITNNSYGSALDNCTYFGDYDGTSAALDAMVHAHPELLHVFAAANSGNMTCSPYPQRFATIAGGYQPSKNLLTVGAVNNEDANASFSSRGPTDDGRLKPEVVAYGAGRFSTINNHQYASNSGTSFSSPATAGMATLLYQHYRNLHNDSFPDAALIKNIICNSADDLGNTGPDFTFGFGRINGDRAAGMIENHRFTSVNVSHANSINIPLTIGPDVAHTDIMLMWTDPASAPFETVTLVNDLDLRVITPSGDTLKPWILNYTPSGVASAATTGSDRLNNYEQVTIITPVTGIYTIVVNGHSVPMGPQKAWLSWDHCLTGIKVQGPTGGEVFKPGTVGIANDLQYVRWDAYGTGSSTYTAEYSINGGQHWTTIASSISATRRYQSWYPPNMPTDSLLVRVTASNGLTDTSDYHAAIMYAPSGLTASSPCRGYAQISWSSVGGADHYKVFTIRNEQLTVIDTTSATTFIIPDLPPDSAIWVTVCGVFDTGVMGLRARAVQVTANGGNSCGWANDIRMDSIVGLSSGRLMTSSALTATEPLTIRMTNTGAQEAYDFTLHYSINAIPGTPQSYADTLEPGMGINYTFPNTINLSNTGTYDIKVWLTYAADTRHENDTIAKVIRHLTNPMITLPWNEDFNAIPDTTYTSNRTGLTGLTFCDVSMQPNARVRTFAGLPFCHSGERALTVDAIRSGSTKTADLIFTLNLDNYTVNTHDVRLNVSVMHHEIIPDAVNTEAIWIRGSDTDAFVLLKEISNDATLRAQWQPLNGLDISGKLDAAGQDFSSSFQVKFTHSVFATAGQLNSEDGQTIDDLSLHLIEKDIKLDAVVHPSAIACDFGIDTIKARIVNTSDQAVTKVYAYYKLNSGMTHSVWLGTIAAGDTLIAAILPPADFSSPGKYALETWVSSIDDDFPHNDTLRLNILHSTWIDDYPYTESFETGDGGYITDGIKSSWMHGVPGKQNISRGAEGKNVWTTSLSSTHNADETSYLYSPCFDLHGLTDPWLSFAWMYQLETGYDYAWVEYRLEHSSTWTKLGALNSGTSWYNHSSNAWNGNQLKWITTGHDIPFTDTMIQFRWVMYSDVGVEYEGVALDQVHVYDRKPLYTGSNMQWTFPVSGNQWVHLEQSGQRVFSIHPQGQDLGDVTISLFKNAANFLLTDSMYLLSRNWVVTSTMPPSGDILMRGYFSKTEADNLVNASGCTQCISARDGFDAAVLRYEGPNEDGSYANNTMGLIKTYPLDSTTIQPFDNGYFAEWVTDSLSEWWVTSAVTKWKGSLEKKISGAYDDAEEHQDNGSVNPVREALTLTNRDGLQKIGWRFRNITIPQGSYISSAFIEWTSADTSSLPSAWIMQAEKVPDAASFTTSKYNLSLRPLTNHAVVWSPAPWTSNNSQHSSPELRHIIQEVVDQTTWVNGNDLVLLMKGMGLRDAWSYDGDPLKGARLVITWDTACLATGICYVDQSATGMQDGSSWSDAYHSFEQALDRAARCPDITQIWIAGGTYAPYFEMSRTAGFVIPAGLSVYGGFEGDETSISERVYGAFPTILSGDIGLVNVMADNVYHVVTIPSGALTSLLDGVTILDGWANGTSPDQQTGGGMYILGKVNGKQVIIEECSAPAVYGGVGAILTTLDELDIRN